MSGKVNIAAVAIAMCGLRPLAAVGAAVHPIWAYDGDQNAQDDWGALSNDYAACERGTQQSPIVISYTVVADLPPLQFHYHQSKVHMQMKNYTLQIDVESEEKLTIGDHDYFLRHITFHTPSEHTVRYRFWPLEMQFTHEDAAGKLLMVSVLADFGDKNAALQSILDHIPARPAIITEFSLDPGAFLPQERGYYAYTGSLSYPPCTEGVEWRVLKQPITVSKPQSLALSTRFGYNARLEQPVYIRTIQETPE